MKKCFFSLLGILLISQMAFSQCVADAGADTVYCNPFWPPHDTTHLGGNPSASGSMGPYTYTWSATYTNILGTTYHASRFLDDTTSANPVLMDIGVGPLAFFLSVEDNSGNICLDTVTVQYSNWGGVLTSCDYTINPGQSISLWVGMFGGVGPLSYHWEPTTHLSDPDIENPVASPDSSIIYSLTITDSAGCINDEWGCSVQVLPTSVDKNLSPEVQIILAPHPLKSASILKVENRFSELLKIEWFDVAGRRVHSQSFRGESLILKRENFEPGVYLGRVSGNHGFLGK